MRTLLFLISIVVSIMSKGQGVTSFPAVKFDKVVMYDYEQNGEDPSLVDKNGQVLKTVKIKKQVQLDTAMVQRLNIKIADRKSYAQVTASCFEPHLGVAYYWKDKIVRHVLICLSCNALRADIDIAAQHQNKKGEGDAIYYLGEGMSKPFRSFINGLLIKYNFSHQIQPGSAFDE